MAKMFLGRERELKQLTDLQKIPGAKLIVLRGRRRIGKSRLLEEYGGQFKTQLMFSGMPPAGLNASAARQEFVKQMQRQLHITGLSTNLSPNLSVEDWSDLFWYLSQQTQKGKVLIVLDEITWMAHDDPSFLPKLKNAWDLYFKKNHQLVLALCGSISYWIDKNILSSTGFLGRCALDMTLKELPLEDSLKFWPKNGISHADKLLMLSVTGGVPRYLEMINPQQSATANINRLCFQPTGILFNEFEHIFADLFSKRSDLYKRIVEVLTYGHAEAKTIAEKINLAVSGDIYDYLKDLVLAGFITQDYTWHLNRTLSHSPLRQANAKISKLSHYRLSDNYCRFFLRYIQPIQQKIDTSVNMQNWQSLPGFYSIMGLQFENLVLNNRHLIIKALGINSSDIVCDNPFFQRKTNKQSGCQIDYLIQTRFNTLFICEIKFTTRTLTTVVIDEVNEKIQRLKRPRNYSCVPVLIYAGELSDAVLDEGYFAETIDFYDFLVK